MHRDLEQISQIHLAPSHKSLLFLSFLWSLIILYIYISPSPQSFLENKVSSEKFATEDISKGLKLMEFKYAPTRRVKIRNPYSVSITSLRKKNMAYVMLCNLQDSKYCQTVEPAELIHDFWAVGPLYAFDQSKIEFLYTLHENFKNYMKSFGLQFSTIEGIRIDQNQTYLSTKAGNEPYDIQVQIYDEDYVRENLLNVAIRKLPHWEYVTWIDGHQQFENTYWWEEAIVAMEKKACVQLFKTSARLSTKNFTVRALHSAITMSLLTTDLDFGTLPEFGNAYAIRRDLYYEIGYIFDLCVATGCDLTYVKASIPPTTQFTLLSDQHGYWHQFEYWINHTYSVFKEARTAIRGEIVHFEHEHYIDYDKVPRAFYAAGFNITSDLERDENFTIKIVNPKIRNVMHSLALKYFYVK